MKTLSDKQYREYKDLKKWARREKVLVSAESIKNLEDDIDLPIRKCVAMFALLGFQPMFSCCGFDYKGQPYHKSHQYGHPYINFYMNDRNLEWIKTGRIGAGWIMRVLTRGYVALELKIGMNPHWRKSECIHFAEECVIGLQWLEGYLLGSYSNHFADCVELEDTNDLYIKKGKTKHWQYPPKNPWLIKKELLDTY